MRACEGKVTEISNVQDLHIRSSVKPAEPYELDLIGSVEAIGPHWFDVTRCSQE